MMTTTIEEDHELDAADEAFRDRSRMNDALDRAAFRRRLRGSIRPPARPRPREEVARDHQAKAATAANKVGASRVRGIPLDHGEHLRPPRSPRRAALVTDIIEKVREIIAGTSRPHIRCDFCAKRAGEVRGIVAASDGPTICNECVGLAVGILTEAGCYP
jgi:hypothetical protein